MKIGIVTQPLYNNYGGILQNYALQQVLKGLGHEVKTIDFVYRQSFCRYMLSTCKHILRSIIKQQHFVFCSYTPIPVYRNPIMEDFIDKHITLTKTVHSYTKQIITTEKFDAVITGSDQVWRPKYNVYIQDMFLKFVPDKVKKIAYAASFGVDFWEYKKKLTKECAVLAQKMDAISVREKSAVDLCENNLHVNAIWVLDPTVLAGVDVYKPLLKRKYAGNYLFAYILDMTIEKRKYIEDIAKEYSLEVRIHGADKDALLSVEDWLSMIANSSFVVTDSFHGTVFSILFHKEFYSIVNMDRGGTRFTSLLYPLGLDNRLCDIDHLHYVQNSFINWDNVEAKIEDERKKSMDYLVKSLK